MKDNSIFRELSGRLLRLFPPAGNLRGRLQSRIHSTLKLAFEEYGLITKDEFDQQLRTLNRAQARIDKLEKTLDQLESDIKNKEEPKE